MMVYCIQADSQDKLSQEPPQQLIWSQINNAEILGAHFGMLTC